MFWLIVPLLLFLIHYYLWRKLVRNATSSVLWRRLGAALLVLFALGFFASMVLFRFLPLSAARPLVTPSFLWIGIMFLLLVLVAGSDLVRLMVFLVEKLKSLRPATQPSPSRANDAIDTSRRLFMTRALNSGIVLSTVGATTVSMKSAWSHTRMKEVEVTLSRFPHALNGFSIVQLTDLHIGPVLGRAWLESIVEKTNALKPDLIAITGDLVDGRVRHLKEEVAPLKELRARYGTFFVTGNHEYYSGAIEWTEWLPTLGIRVLRNEHVWIGEPRHGFYLVGIDDFRSKGRAPGHGPDLPKALHGVDMNHETILLAHQPKAIDEAAQHGVGLQLSGHTHGGQIWPFHYVVMMAQPYLSGLYRHSDTTQIYVSQGTGFWGPPMRLGTHSEITKLTLRKSAP